MRIRKHAKISPLVYAASSLEPGTVIQSHVCCQLNQSPWDVMNFSLSDPETPPPPLVYQVDKDDGYMANGTSADCIAAEHSAPSMKFEVGDEMQKWDHDVGIPRAERFDNGGTEIEQEVHKDGEMSLCCKSDGKGWQCKRKAKEGHTLCEHHSSSSSQVKTSNNSNLSHSGVKKSEKPSEIRRRPRAKKPTLSSNPYEYYYYSGFGPRWGKKRGPATKEAELYTSSGGSDASRNDVEVGEPNTPETNYNVVEEEAFPSPRSSSQMDIERGFDYIEDEDDDDDDDDDVNEICQTEKKRARKPIKARSLKSLM